MHTYIHTYIRTYTHIHVLYMSNCIYTRVQHAQMPAAVALGVAGRPTVTLTQQLVLLAPAFKAAIGIVEHHLIASRNTQNPKSPCSPMLSRVLALRAPCKARCTASCLAKRARSLQIRTREDSRTSQLSLLPKLRQSAKAAGRNLNSCWY